MSIGRPFKKILTGIWEGLLKLQSVLLILLMAFITLAMASEVFLRYVLHSPIMGLELMAGYTAVWLYFIGAAYGSYERSHIKAELIHLILKPQALRMSRVVGSVLILALSCLACVWAHQYIIWAAKSSGFAARWGFPLVYIQVGIYVGLILMSFYFLVELIDNVRIMRTGQTKSEGS